MEYVLFKNNDEKRLINKFIPDQIWTIPQNYETNKHYYEMIYKKDNISVPFIWSPFFIEQYIKDKQLHANYEPYKEKKNISVFEPNINIVKYLMYPTLIVEKLYNTNKNIFNKLNLTNAENLINNTYFMSIISMLDIYNENKVSLLGRYATPYFLSTYTDIVLSHQIYNPLNYAYLDALYLGYPLVHNADMIKDAGYYYQGFDVDGGKEKLNTKGKFAHDGKV
jgi:hypothetical protein